MVDVSEDDLNFYDQMYMSEIYEFIELNPEIFEKIEFEAKKLFKDDETRYYFMVAALQSIVVPFGGNESNGWVARYEMVSYFQKKIQTYFMFMKTNDLSWLSVMYVKLLAELKNMNILKEEEKYSRGKSTIFYSMEIKNNTTNFNFCFSHRKYIYVYFDKKEYSVGLSIHSAIKLQKPHNYNNYEPIIDSSGIRTMDSVPIRFNPEVLEIAESVFSYMNPNTTVASLEADIRNIKENLKLEEDTSKLELSQISTDMKEDDILNSINNIMYKKYVNIECNKKKIAEYNRNYSITMDKIKLLKLFAIVKKIGNKEIFLQHFQDFRGRMYCNSQLSPICNKVIRQIIRYNDLSLERLNYININLNSSNTFRIAKKYFFLVDPFLKPEADNITKVTLIFLFIELAKPHKTKMLCKTSFSLHLESFIRKGIDIYNGNSETYQSFNEVLESKKNIFYIKKVISEGVNIDFPIPKDSTASVLQHLFNWLGPLNTEALVLCNLAGDDSWHDPYSFIISRFLKTMEGRIPENYLKYFTRKSLKRCIMTYNYSVTLSTATSYFIEDIGEEPKNEDLKELRSLFNIFFNFLIKNSSGLLYKKSEEEVFGKIPNIVIIGNDSVPMSYFKGASLRLQKQIHGSRVSLNLNTISDVIDIKKTKNAVKPNLIHYTDSRFAKKIIEKHPQLVVHDEFLVPISDICFVIDYANYIFPRVLLGQTTYAVEDPVLLDNYCFFILL